MIDTALTVLLLQHEERWRSDRARRMAVAVHAKAVELVRNKVTRLEQHLRRASQDPVADVSPQLI